MKQSKTQYLYGTTKQELDKELYLVTLNIISRNISADWSIELMASLVSDARQSKRLEILKTNRTSLYNDKRISTMSDKEDIRLQKIADAIKVWEGIQNDE